MSLFSVKNNEIYVTYRINSNKNGIKTIPEPIIQAIFFFLYSPNMAEKQAEKNPSRQAIIVPTIYKTPKLHNNATESKTVPTSNQSEPRASCPRSDFSLIQTPLTPQSADYTAPHHFTDKGPRLGYSGSWVDYNLLPDFLRDYCLTKAYEMIEDAGD